MYKFGALGAQTNAFTSFSRTSYLFSTLENSYECTELLLDFVQNLILLRKMLKRTRNYPTRNSNVSR